MKLICIRIHTYLRYGLLHQVQVTYKYFPLQSIKHVKVRKQCNFRRKDKNQLNFLWHKTEFVMPSQKVFIFIFGRYFKCIDFI